MPFSAPFGADNSSNKRNGAFSKVPVNTVYVHNISSGKATPPMKEFFAICEYFELTPQQFFDEGTQNPELIQKAINGMKQLDEKDMLMLLGFINRMLEKK